jgi:hypothetical protein
VLGSLFCNSSRFLSTPKHPEQLWIQPSFYLIGQRALCPGVRRPGREVEQPPPSSATNVRMSFVAEKLPEDGTLVPKDVGIGN